MKHSKNVSHLSNKKTLLIGFDFGTHSTKVVLRERGQDDGMIARFDDPAYGYPTYTSPSLVRMVDNRFFFGTKALNMTGGKLYQSLKVRLLTAKNNVPVSNEEFDHSSLVAAYLAWSFQKLKRSLKEKYDRVFLNVAAPMSQVENPILKDKYLTIVQTAWSLAFENDATPITQGITFRKLSQYLTPRLQKPVIPASRRQFEVLPETIAPVVSLSLDPLMESGMYIIVDTGAGTTEVSVFHADNPGADQQVLCYCDETILLGGNDLRKLPSSKFSSGASSISDVISKITNKYSGVWQKGYQCDQQNHVARRRWKELTLVLSGGGTLYGELAMKLKSTNPMYPWPNSETNFRVSRHRPGNLGLDMEKRGVDLSIFAVANGLALERKKWPIVFQPNQIESLEPTEEVESKPQGYWYLDSK